jgi:predicted enzyme related to lactoylglutathione lyase
MARFVQSAAILEVKDVKASEAFFREKLGFQRGGMFGEPPVFCITSRDDVSVFLDQSRTLRPTPLNQYWAAYIYVDDVDGLAAEFQSRGVEIIRGPCDQEYGCREIDVRYPDGHVIGFGQNRASSAGKLTLPPA